MLIVLSFFRVIYKLFSHKITWYSVENVGTVIKAWCKKYAVEITVCLQGGFCVVIFGNINCVNTLAESKIHVSVNKHGATALLSVPEAFLLYSYLYLVVSRVIAERSQEWLLLTFFRVLTCNLSRTSLENFRAALCAWKQLLVSFGLGFCLWFKWFWTVYLRHREFKNKS